MGAVIKFPRGRRLRERPVTTPDASAVVIILPVIRIERTLDAPSSVKARMTKTVTTKTTATKAVTTKSVTAKSVTAKPVAARSARAKPVAKSAAKAAPARKRGA
jgi:hypothetical protein